MMTSNICKTSGGKGNLGKFIERDTKVCAAGVPSSQPNDSVAKNLQHYLLQEEVDALIGDAIGPAEKPLKLPPLRRPIQRDMRNAGPFGEAANLINPPLKTKFQCLVQDLKETVYSSYWKKNVSKVPDPVPILPAGFNIYTTLGKKFTSSDRLYDIVMPKDTVPDDILKSRHPGYQINRNYCKPAYDPNRVYGKRANIDIRGKFVKCCLTNDAILQGTNALIPLNTIQVNIQNENRSILGEMTTPNNNINCVPDGFTFGKALPESEHVPECMATCDLNPKRKLFLGCLAHINTVRKFLSKRFESTFFQTLYLTFRYMDKEKSGWLPKEVVYNCCNSKLIRFNPTLLEPLLCMWDVFDGSSIEYKTFVRIINFTQVIPNLPKVLDIPEDCIDFRTTYKEMVKEGQEINNRGRSGLPSGRYFDMDYPVTPEGYCKADRVYIPQESDARACINPTLFTLLGVSHRDMYARREPETIRRVFKAAGDEFDDEEFNIIWDNAKKYHSEGWVSYETFRRSITELKSKKNETKKELFLF